jgi:3,4-dihydroxy 2-butanone 4-phosphate synthase/GTP cyclohydrolase II
MSHLTIEQAIDDIKNGKMVILVDDKDRENEGDLCMAAESVTPEVINFMATYGRGLICLAMTAEKCDSLDRSALRCDHRHLSPRPRDNDFDGGSR